jgi:hypothetical protein
MKYYFFATLILISTKIYSQLYFYSSSTGVPEGYELIDFGLSPDNKVYIICSEGEGDLSEPKLLTSNDKGQSWSEVNMNGIDSIGKPTSIIFSENKLFLSLENIDNKSGFIYESTDNGENWTINYYNFPLEYKPKDFAIDSSGNIYVFCFKGVLAPQNNYPPKLLTSKDNGSSWLEVDFSESIDGMHIVHSVVSTGSKLIISGSNLDSRINAIYSSVDNGLNWNHLDLGNWPSRYNDIVVNKIGDIYAAGQSSIWDEYPGGAILIKATEDATTWSDIEIDVNAELEKLISIEAIDTILLITDGNKIYSTINQSTPVKITKQDNIHLYPNPAKDILKIVNNSELIDQLLILDIHGRVIQQIVDLNTDEIDISLLFPNIYFIYIKQRDKIYVTKIVKE